MKISSDSSIDDDTEFDVDYCTEDELIARCKQFKMSRDAIELAINFFIYRTKQSILADQLCIEEKSVQQQKRRWRKRLNKIL